MTFCSEERKRIEQRASKQLHWQRLETVGTRAEATAGSCCHYKKRQESAYARMQWIVRYTYMHSSSSGGGGGGGRRKWRDGTCNVMAVTTQNRKLVV